MVDVYRFQKGTSDSSFGIGLNGCIIKNESDTKLSIKNNADNALSTVEVANPSANNDAVNKITLDKDIKPIKVAREADCTSAIPDNTGSAGWVLVTTAGTGCVIGDLLYDNGTSTGTMALYEPLEGDSIIVTAALTGFSATLLYIFKGTAWATPSESGFKKVAILDYTFADTTKVTGVTLPANAIITQSVTWISTAFSSGTTITVGSDTDADLFQLASHIKATKIGGYETPNNEKITSAWGVVVTIAGSPTVGAGRTLVEYVTP
jgi:hypothetical protein